ncbi:hypothetical protein [Pseudomonas monsensis]|uniref:hypothetical protein n=1 Tax=Pseudomonas monsensis TaxID=2745509 RepID=UPI00300E89F8
MSTVDRVNQLVMQLLRDTNSGLVNWHSTTAPDYFDFATDDVISEYYTAQYFDVEVAVYEARYKYYFDEDNYTWSADARFAIMRNGMVVHDQRHSSPALSNLLVSVRGAAGGLNSILDSLLSPRQY